MSDNVVNFMIYKLNKELKQVNDKFIQDLTDQKIEVLSEKALRKEHNERVLRRSQLGKFKYENNK